MNSHYLFYLFEINIKLTRRKFSNGVHSFYSRYVQPHKFLNDTKNNRFIWLTFLNFNSFLFKQISQSENFLFEFTDQLSICIFINDSLANDLFGTICIPVFDKIVQIKVYFILNVFKLLTSRRKNPSITILYLNVESVSSQLISAGDIAAIIAVLELPPRFSRRIHVSTESR